MQKLRRLLMSLALILAGTALWAQQVDISGTVLDDLGEGLPGATVREKGNEHENGYDKEQQPGNESPQVASKFEDVEQFQFVLTLLLASG